MVLKLNGFYAPAIPKLKWDPKSFRYKVQAAHGHGGGHGDKHGEPEGHGGGHGGHGEEEEEHEEHHHDPLAFGGWMFLFIDLVLVALTSKCAQVMEFCALSAHTFLFASIVFTVMFLTRQHLDEYCNRFYANDLFHRLCYFLYVGAFFVMALNVNSWPNHSHLDWKCTSNLYGVGFGVAYCMTRGIMCMLYLGVMYDEPEKAVEQFTGPLVRNILVITITVILMFCETQAMSVGNKGPFPPANRMYIYLIATFLEWGYDIFHNVVLAFKKTGVDVHPVFVCLEYYPLNLVVYQERLGAFIMLVLGESMICLLVPYFDMDFASQTYSFHCISYCIIFCYGIMYYDSSNHGATEDTHAVNHSLLSNFLYFWLHVFVGLAVFMTSASMGILYLKEVASDGTHRRRLGEEGLLFEDAQTYNAGGFRALSFGHGRMLDGHDDGRSDKTLYPPEDDLSAPLTDADGHIYYNPFHTELCYPTQLLSASVGMAVVFMGIMRTLHNGIEAISDCEPNAELAKERWALAWRMGCGVFHFTVPFYGLTMPVYNAAIHMALLVMMLLLEVKYGEDEEEGHGDKGHGDAESEVASQHGGHGGHGGRGGHGPPRGPPRYSPHSAAAMMHKDPRAMAMLNHGRHSGGHPLGPPHGRRPSEHGSPMHTL